jgi:hypothetical protein
MSVDEPWVWALVVTPGAILEEEESYDDGLQTVFLVLIQIVLET